MHKSIKSVIHSPIPPMMSSHLLSLAAICCLQTCNRSLHSATDSWVAWQTTSMCCQTNSLKWADWTMQHSTIDIWMRLIIPVETCYSLAAFISLLCAQFYTSICSEANNSKWADHTKQHPTTNTRMKILHAAVTCYKILSSKVQPGYSEYI